MNHLSTTLKTLSYLTLLPAAFLLTGHHLLTAKHNQEVYIAFTALFTVVLCIALYGKDREVSFKTLDFFSSWGQLTLMGITLAMVWVFPQAVQGSKLSLLPLWGMAMAWHWALLHPNRPLIAALLTATYFLMLTVTFWHLYNQGYSNFHPLDVLILGVVAAGLSQVIPQFNQQLHLEAKRSSTWETLATQDTLTGLPNRQVFQQDLSAALSHEMPAHLVVFDIDHFKRINDQHGHDTGDVLLREVAERTRALFHPDVTYRWGGEEFCVITLGGTPSQVLARCEKARRDIERQTFSRGIRITVSVGITQVRPSDDAQSVFRRADMALLDVKSHGRNQSRLV